MKMLGRLRRICQASRRCGKNPMAAAFGFLRCRLQYGLTLQQYLDALGMTEDERRGLVQKALERRQWYRRAYAANRFLHKYGSLRYDRSQKSRERRIKAYRKFYALGANCFVGHNVEMSQRHCLNGRLITGDHVNFAENVYIDYSGDVIIGDHVMFSDGAHILTHDHEFQHTCKTYGESNALLQGHLEIAYGAVIGTKAIIMPSCHFIGRYAKVDAGAVVTHDVPDYAVVAGVPAKILRFLDADGEGGGA